MSVFDVHGWQERYDAAVVNYCREQTDKLFQVVTTYDGGVGWLDGDWIYVRWETCGHALYLHRSRFTPYLLCPACRRYEY